MIFDREHECMNRDDLRLASGRASEGPGQARLRSCPLLQRPARQERHQAPTSSRGWTISRQLPFTRKYNLRDEYPFGLFATPLKEVVRIHASSGTTGKPTTVGYTRNDINMWAEVMARALACAGATEDDVVQVAYGYGLFTGGLGRSLRRRAARRLRHPHLGQQHPAPAHAHAGLRHHRRLLHAELRSLRVGRRSAAGHRRHHVPAEGGGLRRRALVGGHAQGHRAQVEHQGLRHLRPVRDHRARECPASASRRSRGST